MPTAFNNGAFRVTLALKMLIYAFVTSAFSGHASLEIPLAIQFL